MELVPWPANSFDVVTAFNSIQYALDPERALAEAARVARPSGVLAVCKWGPPSDNAFFAFLAELGAGAVRSDELAVDPVANAIRAVRLDVLGTGDVAAPIVMANDAALQAALARAGIDAGPFAGTGGGDVIEAARRYRQPDGSCRFDNRLRYWLLRPR
jgi:SAM-dependent methyltransferase